MSQDAFSQHCGVTKNTQVTRCRVSKKATDTDKLDRRHFNDPHRTVRAIGAEAARKGLRVFDCPYSHPAMRASWLKGFAQEQQQQLDF
ncbi:CrpP family protein [Pseudomonas aeruginosa]|nr:CrpP family protein [Pseudomonas aeruginosa]MBH4138008.1 CrpP family protein [Pseudomonas aeruginosa]HEJ3207925.1 CrpP family protein [Pseudomonas aeruginosa]HEJ3212817.1 CrpP family protein [Pseudomonas aeruginosa]HEJ3462302.1 CrpP family protein [Pseudomonas aeruginosa]